MIDEEFGSCPTCGDFYPTSLHKNYRLCSCSTCIFIEKSKWGKFKDWFFNVQWPFWIASVSACTINTFFLKHSGWSSSEQIIEGLCFGFLCGLVLGELLYDR
jgi:hypothetical protein